MQLYATPALWQMGGLAALAIFMAIAVAFDLLEHRIPNVLVLLMLLTGIALNTLGPANGREGLLAKFPGALGVDVAFWGGVTGLALFLPFYVFGAFGGGDIKLLAALGSFLGPAEVINLALCILIAGGFLAVLRILWAANRNTELSNRMPFALAFAGGLLFYSDWRLLGGALLIHF